LFSFLLSFVIITSFWAGVALLLALVVPGLTYSALFVLFLTTPLQRLIARRFR
jgi:hypothetical protein